MVFVFFLNGVCIFFNRCFGYGVCIFDIGVGLNESHGIVIRFNENAGQK